VADFTAGCRVDFAPDHGRQCSTNSIPQHTGCRTLTRNTSLTCIIYEGENNYRESSWFYYGSWSFQHNWIQCKLFPVHHHTRLPLHLARYCSTFRILTMGLCWRLGLEISRYHTSSDGSLNLTANPSWLMQANRPCNGVTFLCAISSCKCAQ